MDELEPERGREPSRKPQRVSAAALALVQSDAGEYHWNLSSMGRLDIFSATHMLLGSLDFEGRAVYTAAGRNTRARHAWASVREAGDYMGGLFKGK